MLTIAILIASPVVCLFVLYPLLYLVIDSALVSLGLAILITYALVRIISKCWENQTTDKMKAVEQKVENDIAAYQSAYDQERATEAKRLQQKIWQEELAADEHMAQSELVHEIAQCILPAFKQIVEKVDAEAHMNVRVRLALEIRLDTISYYDVANPQSRSQFVFKEEGIADKLSPILRKALCKALVTELRLLILEAFPIDPERKMVQADLEGSVVLKSNVTYVTGYDYAAPEYNDNSYAYAVILYQASKDKAERHF